MAKYVKLIGCLALGLHCSVAMTQLPGEEYEPTPEHIDANFGEEDAARLAAGFSDTMVAGSATSSLAGMTDAADLVVRGLVLAQEYRYDVHGVPSTHTTFLVAEALKGDHLNTEVTLVQPGGPAQNNADKIMMSSHAHYFNVGEEDVLFLETDPENTSPFRRLSVMSRYRILEEKLYSDDGRGVILVPLQSGDDYRIGHGRSRNPDSRFNTIEIGTRRFNKASGQIRLRDPQLRRAGVGKTSVDDAAQEAVQVDVFVDRVKNPGGRRQ